MFAEEQKSAGRYRFSLLHPHKYVSLNHQFTLTWTNNSEFGVYLSMLSTPETETVALTVKVVVLVQRAQVPSFDLVVANCINRQENLSQ